MKRRLLYLPIILGILLSCSLPANGQARIDRIEFPNPNTREALQIANMYVPQGDTSLPAYGGRLTIRDVYVAKMFEATYYACNTTESRRWQSVAWSYYLGRNNRESYVITCNQANQIVGIYGLLSGVEVTIVYYYQSRNNVTLPVLDIAGAKINEWIAFARGFRAEGND